MEEYSACDHILVNTLHDYDEYEGRSYNYCGCIKCGLDQRVLYFVGQCGDTKILPKYQEVMYEFLRRKLSLGGINTKIFCDLDLASSIYKKIKENNKDIDDETAIEYLKIALKNIRENKVSEERKQSRAKRLSLIPTFNKWSGWDLNTH